MTGIWYPPRRLHVLDHSEQVGLLRLLRTPRRPARRSRGGCRRPSRGRPRLVVDTPSAPMGCRCGAVAVACGRREVSLVDVPCGGRAVRLIWRRRTWRCPEAACPVGSLTRATTPSLARGRCCAGGVVGGRSDASRARLGRLPGPLARLDLAHRPAPGEAAAADHGRRPGSLQRRHHAGCRRAWLALRAHRALRGRRARSKELTGMVHLSGDHDGRVHARLPDLVAGRSGTANREWFQQRGDATPAPGVPPSRASRGPEDRPGLLRHRPRATPGQR